MKKILRIIYTSFFIAFCGCFLLACIDIIEPPASRETSGGEGTFSLEVGSEPVARTILPTTVQSGFLAYTLVFSSNGRDNVIVDRTNSNLAGSVTLPAATWNLTVTAFTDNGRTKPAAQNTLTNIEITAGANVSRSLELKPIIESGATGTFSWDIGYPTEVTVASMKITPLNTASGTPEQTCYFIGGTPLVNKNNTSSPLTLNTGYYRVVFSLSNGQHSTGREEYLHVYKNMDSRFTYTFNKDHFTFLSVTNGNDSGLGSLRDAITNAASNNTILIENGVGTIQLTSRLSISKNLTIAGNGVTITRNSSMPIDDSSQLLYISGSNTTLTISRAHFKDGRASIGPAVIIQSGSVNLESCIFSGNQGTNSNPNQNFGAIYNTGTMNVRGCTFYGNSAGFGAAIYNTGTLTLTGNLFYGNTAATASPVVRNNGGNVSSTGYNAVDAPLGTANTQSGWTGQGTDKVISNLPIAIATFRLLSGRDAQNVITTRPSGYPTVDFYGNSIPSSGAAAGAVQAVASGYLIDLSVNNSVLGSAAITSPSPNADGLYSGSVTFTATSKGVSGYSFLYWLANNNYYTANPLTLTPANHSRVQAVYGRSSTPGSVKRIIFSGAAETVTFSGLSSNDIYLVKVNISENIVSATNTGGPSGSSPSLSQNFSGLLYAPENEFPRMGHPDADAFNANPPPIVDAGPRRSRAVFVPPVVGDTRLFWVESYYGSGTYVQKQATLRAVGQYGNIWIMDENYTSGTPSGKIVNDVQAKALSDKFDLIYPIETDLLGFEYGGGPGGDGGKDGDPKIQILIYSLVNASGVAQAAGFFHSKDFYDQSQLSTQKTNLAEIFYVDSGQVNSSISYTYSTLVHEFQHMINFNMKRVKQGKASESWYNEMLSMMAQDVIDPLIQVPLTVSAYSKMPTFLTTYNQVGITEWIDLGDTSYAKGYAFGAYLLRNYGGASLLKEMLANNSVNIDSVTAAMSAVAGSGLSFEEALRRFGEALIYSGTNMPADVLSLDKTVSRTIGSYTYTVEKFNIWTDFDSNKPRIFGANEQLEMKQHSITVHQDAGWKNKSGNFSVTLQKPADSSVEFYLMMK
jgi:hypothetical protein